MHSLTLILCLFFICHGCKTTPCNQSDQPIIAYYHQVAQKVIDADRSELKYCNQSSIKEEHGPEKFQLVVKGVGKRYQVLVRNRVVFIGLKTCGSKQRLRTLPSYVDAYAGHYCFERGTLNITFPYMYGMKNGSFDGCAVLQRRFNQFRYSKTKHSSLKKV